MGPTPFEQHLRRGDVAVVEERRVRAAALRSILELTGVTIDDVVNSRCAKRTVLNHYLVLDASLWEGRRRRLHERAAYEQWVRANR